jgi:hypothetical protein
MTVDRIILAFDKTGSVRHLDEDGRLHVDVSNISKAVVNPYWGREIPSSDALGLDPNKKYMLLRHPTELQRAAKTFNNLPILAEHVPINATKHRQDLVIGSTGTDASYQHPYLRNSLVFWTQPAIDAIQSGVQKELSCAYHYDPVMKPGVYNGQAFDGIMTNLRGNHLALVEDGRAGADVLVADAMPVSLKNGSFIERSNAMAKLSPAALVARTALWTYLTPRLAQDQKIDFDSLVRGVTSKNYNSRQREIFDNVQRAANGKLAQDADVQDLVNLLSAVGPEVNNADQTATLPASAGVPMGGRPGGSRDQLENLGPHGVEPGGELPPQLRGNNDQLPDLGPLAAPGQTPGGPAAPGSVDQGGAALLGRIKQYLMEQGVSPEIINNLDALAAAGDEAQDETDNYAPPGIEDPSGSSIDPTPLGEGTLPGDQPEADDPEFPGSDAMPKNFVTRRAMDQAIRVAQDHAIRNQRQIREAERFVRPWVGELAMDANTPADVYRVALRALGVKGSDRMHADALRPVLEAQPRPSARVARDRQYQIATDSNGHAEGSFADRFPDAAKIILQ